MSSFEADLERGLHDLFDHYLAEQPPPRRRLTGGRASIRVAGGLGGALALKIAAGAAIAALAAGAGVEAASTHSLNPVDWGRAVSRQVQGRPATPIPAAVRATATPAAVRQTPAKPPSGSPVHVSPPVLSQPTLPAVSPVALPTLVPTAVPKLP